MKKRNFQVLRNLCTLEFQVWFESSLITTSLFKKAVVANLTENMVGRGKGGLTDPVEATDELLSPPAPSPPPWKL